MRNPDCKRCRFYMDHLDNIPGLVGCCRDRGLRAGPLVDIFTAFNPQLCFLTYERDFVAPLSCHHWECRGRRWAQCSVVLGSEAMEQYQDLPSVFDAGAGDKPTTGHPVVGSSEIEG